MVTHELSFITDKQAQNHTASQLAVSTKLKFKEIPYNSGADTKQGVLTQRRIATQISFSHKILLAARHKECKLLEEV
jgi:hypothetical protein